MAAWSRPFVLAVAGTRDDRTAAQALPHLRERLAAIPRPFLVATGGASGVDALAEQEAMAAGAVCVVLVLPNWQQLGRGAGPVRSRLLLELLRPDLLLAYPNGQKGEASHVTWWTVDAAQKMGVPVEVVVLDGREGQS